MSWRIHVLAAMIGNAPKAVTMRVLLGEDEPNAALVLAKGLREHAYAVDVACDGDAAIFQVGTTDYDAVILDVMLPRLSGYRVCEQLRASGSTVPVLMLTARDSTGDKVTGLDSGADDYLVKPFAFEELLARLRTLLRRPRQALPATLKVGDLSLDPARRQACLRGEPLALSTKEFGLLELFLRNPGRVLSRDYILDHAWDDEFDSFSNIVDVYVGRLRRKIASPARPSRIEAVRGVGYVLRDGEGPGV